MDLPNDARGRVAERMTRWAPILTVVMYLGFALLLLGVLKMFNIVRYARQLDWGMPTMALGFCVVCVERILRAWAGYGAVAAEDTDGSRKAKVAGAAMFLTAVEVVLGAGLMWYVLANGSFLKDWKKMQTAKATTSKTAKTNGTTTNPKNEIAPGIPRPPDTVGRVLDNNPMLGLWVTETQAKGIVGKSDAYFKKLVRFQGSGIRTKKTRLGLFYREDDIRSIKQQGLLGEEDLDRLLKDMDGDTEPKDAAPVVLEEGQVIPEGEALQE